jgi:hypothetical protein
VGDDAKQIARIGKDKGRPPCVTTQLRAMASKLKYIIFWRATIMNSSVPRKGQYHTSTEAVSAHGARTMRALGLCVFFVLGGCGGAQSEPFGSAEAATTTAVQSEEHRVWVTVGERRFAITLNDTEAARAFAAMLPLTIAMADLNSNEKHAELPASLPANASRPGTIRNGDLMLYGTNTLVLFYVTFESSYSYTRLGRVDDPAGLAQALGSRDVRVVFSRN